MRKAYRGSSCVHYGFADELRDFVTELFAPVGELTEILSDGFTLTATLELHGEAQKTAVDLSTTRLTIEQTSVPHNRKVTIDLKRVFEFTYRTPEEAIERLMPAIRDDVARKITRWIGSFESA